MQKAELYSPDPALGWIPWVALAPVLGIVFIMASILPFDLLFTKLGYISPEGDFSGAMGLLLFLLFPFSVMALVVCLWTSRVEKRPLSTVGLTWHSFANTFPRYVLLGISMGGLLVLTIGLLGGYQVETFFPAWVSAMDLGVIALFLLAFVVQSSAEELLFRGWLLSAITRKSNLVLGMLLSSALFTLLHFEPDAAWYVALGSFLFSLFACMLVLYTRNVWSAMGWHAGWNWFIGCGFEIPITGVDVDAKALVVRLIPTGENWLNGGGGGPENSIANIFMLSVGLIVCFLLVRRSRSQ